MHDLTQGSITGHIVKMALPIFFGMLFQVLYLIVDLYFVTQIGAHAVAGVNAAGNLTFLVMAVTQVLGVGTTTLIAQAVGRKDHDDANLVFNQSLAMAGLCALITTAAGYLLLHPYMQLLGADDAARGAGVSYMQWYLPSLALQYFIVAMGSALRGTGIAQPTMVVQMLTVVINAILAPILIAGWGTGVPMGVAGAGLATTISLALGAIMLAAYFMKLEKYVAFTRALWAPRFETWSRVLRIGLPAGGEFGLMFIYMGMIYVLIREFGTEAQAGFAVGGGVMRAIFLPAMAVAFATAPVAAQNMGARKFDRVRETFRVSVVIGSVVMLALTLLAQISPEGMVRWLAKTDSVTAVGAEFLRYISWNFVAQGIVFTCSGMFQALGNTVPAMVSSATRLITFAIPVVWWSQHPGFQLHDVWMVSMASVALQAVFSLLLLRGQFRKRLQPLPEPAAVPA